jgi:hypothetical protein
MQPTEQTVVQPTASEQTVVLPAASGQIAVQPDEQPHHETAGSILSKFQLQNSCID